jgi:hypothetical protein
VLEELSKRGLTATVVLPFPEADFVALSVGGDWNERLARVKQTPGFQFTEPVKTSRPADAELPSAFRDANRAVQKRALEYARRLDETPIVLAVWDGKEGDGPGGTADAVDLWRDEGIEPDIIDITKI